MCFQVSLFDFALLIFLVKSGAGSQGLHVMHIFCAVRLPLSGKAAVFLSCIIYATAKNIDFWRKSADPAEELVAAAHAVTLDRSLSVFGTSSRSVSWLDVKGRVRAAGPDSVPCSVACNCQCARRPLLIDGSRMGMHCRPYAQNPYRLV